MTLRVRWLHISDFHFQADRDAFSQTTAANALIDDIASRLGDETAPSFAVVTGDLAFSGRESEYEAARPYLERLSDAAGVPRELFYFVPGNHDVDRAVGRLHWVGACVELTSEAAVDQLIGTEEDVARLLERQAAFWTFVESFTSGQERHQIANGLGYVARISIQRMTLEIIGLNSAWLSGKNSEEMKLLVGERQVVEALGRLPPPQPSLQIALAHHPIEWMQEWDQAICRTRLLSAVDIFHRGHLHHSDVSLAAGPSAPCLVIAAGSSHATRFYGNAYNVVDLDIGTGQCVVQPYRYDPTAATFEPGTVAAAAVELHGSRPSSSVTDTSVALTAAVPEGEPHASYMAALLVGRREEVPIRLESSVEFVVPRIARELVGDAILPAEAFIGLRNLLQLYDESVTLAERLSDHSDTVGAFVAYLEAVNATGAPARTAGQEQATMKSSYTDMAQTRAFLEALRISGDRDVVEEQARRLMSSQDPVVARDARRALVDAGMRSDELPQRAEALALSIELIATEDAALEDYMLAAGAAEASGADADAIRITLVALEKWPAETPLQSFARRLATRTGSSELRAMSEVGGS